MIRKTDVTIPMMPGVVLQSSERPTMMEHTSMPTRATNATIRALVLTLPSLILAQMPPQKLEQQPGSSEPDCFESLDIDTYGVCILCTLPFGEHFFKKARVHPCTFSHAIFAHRLNPKRLYECVARNEELKFWIEPDVSSI